ncbi:MAG: DNA repair protein RadC [Acetobacterales bacterium]
MADAERPHYHGHRDRLRQRLLDGGADALPDYELLELVLFLAIPRKDTKPIAKRLLDRFKTFDAVITADPRALRQVEGVGEAVVAALKTVQAAALRLSRTQVIQRDVLSSWDALMDYCTATMAREKTEQLRLLFLDRKNVLIDEEVHAVGTVDHTPLYPREVVRRALEIGASALILVHNHPSGDPTPSSADVEMTRKVKEAAAALGITLHDHVIIGRNRYTSFRSEGLL